jgi:hypothetical protein
MMQVGERVEATQGPWSSSARKAGKWLRSLAKTEERSAKTGGSVAEMRNPTVARDE